jgi:DNA polymerase III delta subunit|tara:strand:+ start:598 stop:1584 length:987 start_codon:yes stop_codon:yes gene_type:complete
LICEATSLTKYIDKSPRLFFIFGPEIILKNTSIDQINEFYKKNGFTEKKAIFEKDFKDIERILIENAGGSLFGSKTIIEIFHNGGKIPKEITNIFEIPNINKMENIVIIIRSAVEKINQATKWVKKMNDISLIVQCAKLKPYEEKVWVKGKLTFMNEEDAKNYTDRITDMFSGNLVAQNNEINVLKLTYSEESNNVDIGIDDAEFLPYQLEDKIIELNTNYALRISKSIKKNDDHYGPLLVFIMGKIINTSVSAYQNINTNSSLEKAGIWKSKIPAYVNFIKKNTLKKMMPLQKKVYELDLAAKGLAGITKDQFWQEIDNMIIDLTST